MNLKKLKIGDLVMATYNPRKDLTAKDKEYQKIKNSITEFGYVTPIIVNADLEYEEIECIVVDFDKDKEKLLNVALNKISGEWDYQKLETMFNDLENNNIDLSITGFEEKEINDLLDDFFETTEDGFDVDKAVEEIKTPISKKGDIWILGNHRLMCGDSTSAEDVNNLISGATMDLCITDPPYNVNYGSINESGYGKQRENGNKILNDNMDDESFYLFLKAFYTQMIRVLKPGGAYYIFHADTEGYNFRKALIDAGGQVKQNLIWVKNTFVLGRQDYQWKHEPCLYRMERTEQGIIS